MSPPLCRPFAVWVLSLLAAVLGNVVHAAPPWTVLLPFKRIDADPKKDYSLTEQHGPWLILASSFNGPDAERRAQELVVELRQRYKLPAYTHKQHYDFTQAVTGRGVDRYGAPKKMKYAHAEAYDSIAVLVGEYPTIDDPKLEKTLDVLKHTTPECLDRGKNKKSSSLVASFRDFQRLKFNPKDEKRRRGPMGSAFVTRNPLLPAEFFTAGVDGFVLSMNKDVEYSLLDNPGKYSVQVASFRGDVTMNPNDADRITNRLEEAALKAHKLTQALRAKGYESYEFHDRHQSVVTVGHFDSVGEPRPDGKTEINPAVHQLMETFAASRTGLNMSGQQVNGLQPKVFGGVPCDAQPIPVTVPKRSLGAVYVRNP